jgi:hypothetical protein
MKVAICFFGLVSRSLSRTFLPIKKFIFDELDKCGIEYKVFLHSYVIDKISGL